MRGLNVLSLILLIIGGLNWLLVGLFQWDLVGGLTGGMDSVLARIVYIIVGLAAIYAFSLFNKVNEEDRTPAR
ncbi:DUF378 domain-containing protein [Paenibacillus aurantius]|uniref:DUF378 domain-containing protein n=1 Tax=Paenibacillus aurantius TaxID=2918900 RepID=A0AA96LEE3_9BACL|nr:DUF378 domain-containing protein [Paenibacillus aurantius]WJH35308.1 DUF378 domain-containing protein [Paenibacillus sp. CC-CFT747]WNQ10580.1 DUF378 domain-containing protein [Paenibacillus aurantius]